ncbi:MAG: potassium transporter TrkG [bacterium]
MLLKPRKNDYQIIGYYSGIILIGLGFLMIVPFITAILFSEWNCALDYVIGMGICLSTGYGLRIACYTNRDLHWYHGMVVAAVSWFLATILGAVPYWLSGYFNSYLDACFDMMSGYTTTGLVLIQDINHLPHSLNMWRHILTYVGGQGIIVVALTFLMKSIPGAYRMYVGEGKDERLLPNVVQTARAIWIISIAYLVIGSLVLWGILYYIGLSPVRSLLHSLWLFMGAWSTGGFTPQSQNILYYHSLSIEVITCIISIVGSLNFALHYVVWKKGYKEIYRNIETFSFSLTVVISFIILSMGLKRGAIFPHFFACFRKGFYTIISAHTTTGNMTIYGRQLVTEWGPLAMLGIILAMSIGGSASSTAGGFKGLRMGIIFKGLFEDIKKMINPDSAVIIEKIHHIKDISLDDKLVRSASIIVMSFVGSYALGTLIGTFYNYPVLSALFESVSAGSNSGWTCGITSVSMPVLLKVVYIFQMWVGRLEFISIFTLIGFLYAGITGR